MVAYIAVAIRGTAMRAGMGYVVDIEYVRQAAGGVLVYGASSNGGW